MAGPRIRYKGPIFEDAKRRAIMRQLEDNIRKSITEFAFKNVNRILAQKIKNPTPIYQTHIIIDNRRRNPWRVTDQGKVVYNHWLEGTGSRNYPVTRFKGYHAFQRAREITMRRASKLAETQVRRAVKKLGG